MPDKSDMTLNINLKELEALDEFLDKHGDRIQLTGFFTLKNGDALFFRATSYLSDDAIRSLSHQLQDFLPNIKVIVLEPDLELLGVARNEAEVDTRTFADCGQCGEGGSNR